LYLQHRELLVMVSSKSLLLVGVLITNFRNGLAFRENTQ
jgi:hypothetical protein